MRRDDWLDRLWAEVDACASLSFEYGTHDCCTFVARAVEAMTGDPLVAPLAERYHDKRSALQFIAAEGGLVQAVSVFLGQPEEGWPRRGDVALVETEDGPGVGVCVGEQVACAHDGVAFRPATFTTVWRVG